MRGVPRSQGCDYASLQQFGHYVVFTSVSDEGPFTRLDSTFLFHSRVSLPYLNPRVAEPMPGRVSGKKSMRRCPEFRPF